MAKQVRMVVAAGAVAASVLCDSDEETLLAPADFVADAPRLGQGESGTVVGARGQRREPAGFAPFVVADEPSGRELRARPLTFQTRLQRRQASCPRYPGRRPGKAA
jgi:hypothetical protein